MTVVTCWKWSAYNSGAIEISIIYSCWNSLVQSSFCYCVLWTVVFYYVILFLAVPLPVWFRIISLVSLHHYQHNLFICIWSSNCPNRVMKKDKKYIFYLLVIVFYHRFIQVLWMSFLLLIIRIRKWGVWMPKRQISIIDQNGVWLITIGHIPSCYVTD